MTQPMPNRPHHIGPDGYLHRYQPGDEYTLVGHCPNRCGPATQVPGGQRCPRCGWNTNILPAQRGTVVG